MAFVNNLVLLEGFIAGETKRIGENGPAVGQVSVSKRVKDKATKEYVTTYDFIDIKAWGEARDKLAGYTDGTKVIVSGQLDRESWEDKTTQKKVYKTVVLINSIAELPKMDDGPSGFEPQDAKAPAADTWDF
jgi:single-stranded DNA-binding protein